MNDPMTELSRFYEACDEALPPAALGVQSVVNRVRESLIGFLWAMGAGAAATTALIAVALYALPVPPHPNLSPLFEISAKRAGLDWPEETQYAEPTSKSKGSEVWPS